jgi:hypothetical protein
VISPERFVARHLWSGSGARALGPIVEAQKRSHQRAQAIVRAYYGASLLLVASSMPRWEELMDSATLSPPWPAAWLTHFETSTAVSFVVASYAATTLLAALIPENRWARTAAALAFVQFTAVDNGFGKINHASHAWL